MFLQGKVSFKDFHAHLHEYLKDFSSTFIIIQRIGVIIEIVSAL